VAELFLGTEIMDELYDGLYTVDLERRITFWNRAAEKITGYPRAEVIGRSCRDNLLVHVDETGGLLCQHSCPLAATMADGQGREAEVYLHHKMGHRLPVLIRATPLRDKTGRVIGGVEIFGDNSPRLLARQRIRDLERLALVDELTSLPNRRHLQDQILVRLSEQERLGWTFGLLFLDIDRFKLVNDTLGHDMGDQVLTMVGRTFEVTSRPYDLVGRWGGEEFLVVIRNVDDATLARVAERYRVMVQESSLDGPSGPVRVTISVGGTLSRHEDRLKDIINRADECLSVSKKAGRNRVTLG